MTKQFNYIETPEYFLIVGEGKSSNYHYWNFLKNEIHFDLGYTDYNKAIFKPIIFHCPKVNSPVLEGVELFEVMNKETT